MWPTKSCISTAEEAANSGAEVGTSAWAGGRAQETLKPALWAGRRTLCLYKTMPSQKRELEQTAELSGSSITGDKALSLGRKGVVL